MKHVHLCPKCHQRIVCDGDCAIEPDLGTTVHNLPHGATTRCDACGAPDAAPLDLDAIEARANAATDGPWEAPDQLLIPCVRGVSDHGNTIRVCQFGWNNSPDAKRRDANNAVFIAHAREDVPALVAEVRRLRAEPAAVTASLVDALESDLKRIDERDEVTSRDPQTGSLTLAHLHRGENR